MGRGAVSLGVGSDLRRLGPLSGTPDLKSVTKGEDQPGESGKEQKMFASAISSGTSKDATPTGGCGDLQEIGRGTRLEICPLRANQVPAVSFQKTMALSTPVNSAFPARTTISTVITHTSRGASRRSSGYSILKCAILLSLLKDILFHTNWRPVTVRSIVPLSDTGFLYILYDFIPILS